MAFARTHTATKNDGKVSAERNAETRPLEGQLTQQ